MSDTIGTDDNARDALSNDNGGLGSDPLATFGDNVEPAATTYGREYSFDGSGGSFGDDGERPAISGSTVGSGGTDNDGYERNLDGSLRRNRDGSPRRKRGRRKGWRAGDGKNKKSDTLLNVSGIEKVLLSVHGMLSAITKTPELALEDKEAADLALGIAEVAEFYPLDIAPEAYAWVNLFMIAVPIYGSRIFLVAQRRKDEKSARARPVNDASPNVPAPMEPASPRATMNGTGFPDFKTQ
jgi:hypothetical protein